MATTGVGLHYQWLRRPADGPTLDLERVTHRSSVAGPRETWAWMLGWGFRPRGGDGPTFGGKVGNRRSRDELPSSGIEFEMSFGYVWRSETGLFFSLSSGFASGFQFGGAPGVPVQSVLLEPQLGFAF